MTRSIHLLCPYCNSYVRFEIEYLKEVLLAEELDFIEEETAAAIEGEILDGETGLPFDMEDRPHDHHT